MTDHREQDERLKNLLSGPWVELARPVRELLLERKKGVAVSPHDLRSEQLDPQLRLASKLISPLFRKHWPDGIEDDEEMELRDSFDEALTQLQLMEVAVESGYCSLEAVAPPAREQLAELLWSEGARKYLVHYDYLLVRYLAARLEVELGLDPVRPPRPDPEAEVRFATFLSQLKTWYADDDLELWLGFMDDYVQEEDEQVTFAESFRAGPKSVSVRRQERFGALARGAEQFCRLTSNLFYLCRPAERPIYGLFHAYWLAKFLGYDLRDAGYVKDRDAYDWSQELPHSFTELQGEDLRERLDIIRKTFDSIRDLVGGTLVTA